MSHKPKRFHLSFIGPGETLPRMVTAYGRACEGEFALVIRPTEQRALLVLVGKKKRGETQTAALWQTDASSDCPRRPETPTSPAEAVAAIKAIKSKPPRAGDVTLKGRWTGTLVCDGGEPVVTLRRKVATYGWLSITSTTSGWVPSFERLEKWFSEPSVETGEPQDLLSEAITTGVQIALRQVCGACSTRDTTRRQALDSGYADQRPMRVPQDGRDLTERLKVSKARTGATPTPSRARANAAPTPSKVKAVTAPSPSSGSESWRAIMQSRVVKPFELEGVDAFEDFQGLLDTLHAAVHSTQGARERWTALRASGATDRALRAALKQELGTGGGNAATSYGSWSSRSGRGVEVTLGHYIFKGASLLALARLALDLPPVKDTRKASGSTRVKVTRKAVEPPTASTPEALGHQAASVEAEAEALQEAVAITPHNLRRAENLLAYTQRLIDNPHCQGVDKKEALAALQRARVAVDEASGPDGEPGLLQRAGAELALSAAKVARACGRGQLSLTARAAEAAAEKPAPTTRKPRKRRIRKTSDVVAVPGPTATSSSKGAAVSLTDKDQALLGMFQQAITAALRQEGH
jgi:hypothetical protein